MDTSDNLSQLVGEKIKIGENLLHSLEPFNAIEGAQKVQRYIKRELKFLCKVKYKEFHISHHIHLAYCRYVPTTL